MDRLRAPDGCPWDKSQTPASLRPYLIEEAFEVLGELDRVAAGEAMEQTSLCEELGDLLFQVIFHARIAQERGAFSFSNVAQAISDKLERRHPQIFAGAPPCEDDEALARQWAQIKAAERAQKTKHLPSALDGIPAAAPALTRAERMTEKASRVGFDWPCLKDVRAKLDEEIDELDEAIAQENKAHIEAELGDVLLTVVNLARFVDVHPEDALREAIQRFSNRFRRLESRLTGQGKQPSELSLEELELNWQQAKLELKDSESQQQTSAKNLL